MTKSIRAVQLATASMTKFAKVPANETGAMTATRSASLAAAVEKRKQAEAQKADAEFKHYFKRNAVFDKGLEIKLVENCRKPSDQGLTPIQCLTLMCISKDTCIFS